MLGSGPFARRVRTLQGGPPDRVSHFGPTVGLAEPDGIGNVGRRIAGPQICGRGRNGDVMGSAERTAASGQRRRHAAGFAWATVMAWLVAAAFAAGSQAHAADPFTVGSYPVDAEAANAVAAKEQALADGQQAALRSLLKRLVPVSAYPRLKRLSGLKAQNLLAGTAVRTERNSATRYIATLDFSFLPDAVRQTLTREGVPFIDAMAPQAVLVPILKTAGAARQTGWTEAWRGLDLTNTLAPLRLEMARPTLHADTVRMLETGDGSADRIMEGEYNAQLVIAAIAEIDSGAKRLHVTLSGVDAVGPVWLKRSYRLSGGDLDYTMELAAVISLGVLEGRWKAVRARARGGVEVMAAPGVPLQVQVEFQGLVQWNAIRRQLDDTPGVAGLTVNAVSARGADVALSFPGGGAQLAEVLAPQGLQLRNVGGNWFLKASF